jgi:hypothetical protein
MDAFKVGAQCGAIGAPLTRPTFDGLRGDVLPAEHGLIPGDEEALHPALVGCVSHLGRVGNRELAAAVIRLARAGIVTLRTVPCTFVVFGVRLGRSTVELTLEPGTAAYPHHLSHGPYIRPGHIEGLDHIDRALLGMLFDHLAHSTKITLRHIAELSREHRWAYGRLVGEWRNHVLHEAREKGLMDGSRYTGKAGDLRTLKREVRERLALSAQSRRWVSDSKATRVLELAVAFGLRPALARSLKFPRAVFRDMSPSAGIENIWQTGEPGFRVPK